MILGMEPRFHADWFKNRRDRGLCMCCVFNNTLFFLMNRFIDAANAFTMPHLPRDLILMILPFYRTFLSCLEAEKFLKFYFTM